MGGNAKCRMRRTHWLSYRQDGTEVDGARVPSVIYIFIMLVFLRRYLSRQLYSTVNGIESFYTAIHQRALQ